MTSADPHAQSMSLRLRRLPKAELHVHLDGSLRPATMLELAEKLGKDLPASDVASLRHHMEARDVTDLVDYLARFAITLSLMQTAEGLERIAFELAEDLARENVHYAEIRYCPMLHLEEGLALEEVMEAPLRGLARAERELGIRTRLIVCAIRTMAPDAATALAGLAAAYAPRGVVALDLAGAEDGYPAGRFLEAFQRAKHANLAVTIHAGEAYGAESIREAIHVCGADRIGHGTRLFEDPGLLHFARDRRIGLEICLTSNVQTRAVADFASHPLRGYLDAGLLLSLNTDNRLISGTTVSDEYLRAHRYLGFTWEDLVRIARMSFESAFLPWDEKLSLLARFDAEVAALP